VGALDGTFKQKVHAANSATPIFWGHGSIDNVVTPECQVVGAPILKDIGVPVTTGSYEMAHSANAEEFDEMTQWMKGIF